ncbi:T-cell activation Rho GTPase-activating protein-like [Gymnogyps californianus]|uniref:T-cell activation Rho GTPase-activating protein-like n=1 Tax=Gymnogyps californianus TaxID=33616 RepID=UPI0021C87C68|nr:T-cell activation Rho GTPase-activating protein-like [Gymnogyps californianus]
MAAMQKASKEEKIEELKAVAEKLPAANLLLLKRLLALLQHVAHNASTSRMSCSNLAICLAPNLLSPANEDLLPLEAMLEVTEKVKVLVEFLTDNWRELFGEEPAALSCPAAEESPAPPERCRELPLEEQSVPAVRADSERQAEALLQAAPSLLGVLQAAGADVGLESETGEAPPALPPSSPESAADSLVRPEELASLAEERRLSPGQGEKEKPEEKAGVGRGERKPRGRKEEEERNRLGDGAMKRCRKVQQVRKPRCCWIDGHWLKRCDSWAPPLDVHNKRIFSLL